MRDDEPTTPSVPQHQRSGSKPAGSQPVANPAPQARRAAAPFALGLAFATIYLIWGSTYLGIRVAVQTLPPFLLAGARSCLAGAVLLLVLLWRGARAPNAREWRRAALAGTLMLAGGNGLVTWAEKYVPSNLAALSIAAVPSYVAILDWLRPGGQRPSRRILIGVLLGALGMLLLLRPGPEALHAQGFWPQLALVLAGAAWACGSVYARYQQLYPNAAVSGAQQMLAGGAVMLFVSLGRGELCGFTLGAVSAHSWLAFAYLTLFGSMLAFSTYSWLVGVTTPARLSTTAYVNPVVAVVLGWLVLGEPLHPVSLAGGALIVCAVLVMTTRGQRAPRAGRALSGVRAVTSTALGCEPEGRS